MIDGVEFLTVVDFTSARRPPNEDGLHSYVGFVSSSGLNVYLEVGRSSVRSNKWYLECIVEEVPFTATDKVRLEKSHTYYTSSSRDAIAERAMSFFSGYAGRTMSNGQKR